MGYRTRPWDTRLGTLELAIPKLRQGSYFPSWLEPRRRAEQALVAVVAEAYVQVVSTRKVETLVQSLGIAGLSKSEVSRLCSVLDEQAEIFRTRPLDAVYPYIWLDARYEHVRESGRVVAMAVIVAYGVRADGMREVLGIDVGPSEDVADRERRTHASGNQPGAQPAGTRGAEHGTERTVGDDSEEIIDRNRGTQTRLLNRQNRRTLAQRDMQRALVGLTNTGHL